MFSEEPLVAVIILTCNQKQYTLRCLESFSKVSYPNYQIIIVDNDSKDETEEEVSKLFSTAHYVKNSFNAGVAGGRNIGLKYAKEHVNFDYVLIIDNDTTVEHDFLGHLVAQMEENIDVGVNAPKIYLQDEDLILDQAGGSVVNLFTGSTAKRGFGEKDLGQYDSRQTQKCLPSGACSLSRRKTIEQCDGLDEIFNPYGFEDLDYSLRVLKLGYSVAYCPESVIYHKGNKTGFTSYTEHYARIKGRHMRTFLKRHQTVLHKICFGMLLPVLGMRTVFREAKRGNIKAVIQLFRSFMGKR